MTTGLDPRPITVRVVDNTFDASRSSVERHDGADLLLEDVLPERVRRDPSWIVIERGRVIPPDEWANLVAEAGDEIICLRRVRGAVGRLVVGAVMMAVFVAAVIATGGLATVTPLGWIWFSVSLGLLAGGIQSLLMGSLAPPVVPALTSGAQDGSSTYGFGGIGNSTRPGSPIGILYGEHLIGGQLITAYAKAIADSDVLFLLLGLSEGPISSIGAIKINDQPVENYRDVVTEHRLGDNEQTTVGLFAGESVAAYSADALLTTTFLVYTTQGTSVEAIELNLIFPNGLFTLDDQGNFRSKSVTFQIEIKLSSSPTWGTALPGGLTPQIPTAPGLAAGPSGAWAGFSYQFSSELGDGQGQVWNQAYGGPYGVLGGQSYSYRVTFVTKHGETVGGPAATIMLAGGSVPVTVSVNYLGGTEDYAAQLGYQVDVTVPVGDSTTIGRRVYRNGVLIADIAGNSAAVYRDGALGSSSGQAVPTVDHSVEQVPSLTITDARRAVLRRTYRVDLLVPGQYDLRIRRTTTESVSSREADQVRRSGVNEIVKDNYTYPNLALLGVRALATDQLSGGLPKITVTCRGRKVRVLSSATAYTIAWTNNPAWVVLDILLNERFGVGRLVMPVRRKTGTGGMPSVSVTNGDATVLFVGAALTGADVKRGDKLFVDAHGLIGTVLSFNVATQEAELTATWAGATASGLAFELRRDDVDLAGFVAWADFCSHPVEDGKGGFVPRAAVNLYLDADQQSAWDVVNKLAGIGFAALVKIGTYYKVKIERADTPAQLFTMGNIVKDSFEEILMPLRERANVYEGQFLNEEKNYQQDTATYENPLIFTNEEQPRKKLVSMFGVTNPSQAARLVRFYELINRYVTRTITFAVDVDAVAVEPGDLIHFQHDIPQWGFGGRVAAGSTSSTLALSKPITLANGISYGVLVKQLDDTLEVFRITTPPGVYTAVTIDGTWAVTPAKDAQYTIGVYQFETKPFRVIAIERTQDLKARLTCVEYNVGLYAEPTPLQITNFNYSALAEFGGAPPAVENLVLLQQADTPFALWASWTNPVAANFRGARVYRVLPGGAEVLLGDAFNGSFPIQGLAVGDSVTIKVTSIGPAGAETNRANAPRATAILVEAKPPNVSGLSLSFEAGIAYLQWSAVVWVRPVEYEIRKGDTWESAINLGRVFTPYVAAAGDGTYWVAARDTVTGAFSASPSSVLVAGTSASGNVVAMWGEDDTLWPGTVSGGAVVNVSDNVLQLEGTGLIDGVADFDAIVNMDALGGIVSGPGTYEVPASHIVDLGIVKIATVTASFRARGDSLTELWDDVPDFDLWADVDGDYASKVVVQMYLSVSDGAGVFGPWVPFAPGQYSGRKFKMKIELASLDPFVTPVVVEFDWAVDMPDRIEERVALAVSAGGTAVVFDPVFQIVPSTVVTIAGATVGDEISLTAESVSGFTVQIKNGGVGMARVVNTISKGY